MQGADGKADGQAALPACPSTRIREVKLIASNIFI
jgi:hypothetical protein